MGVSALAGAPSQSTFFGLSTPAGHWGPTKACSAPCMALVGLLVGGEEDEVCGEGQRSGVCIVGSLTQTRGLQPASQALGRGSGSKQKLQEMA